MTRSWSSPMPRGRTTASASWTRSTRATWPGALLSLPDTEAKSHRTPEHTTNQGAVMSRGDNLRQRRDGAWEGRYRVEGLRRSATHAPTYNEARKKLRDAITAARAGPAAARSAPDHWSVARVVARLRRASAAAAAHGHLVRTARDAVPGPSHLGRIPVAKLTTDDIGRDAHRPRVKPVTADPAVHALDPPHQPRARGGSRASSQGTSPGS